MISEEMTKAGEEDAKPSAVVQAGSRSSAARAEHLAGVVKDMIGEILNGSDSNKHGEHSFGDRVRYVLSEKGPSLQQAARSLVDEILLWLRQGGALRAFLFTAVGTVILLALSGLATFLVFFLIATTNAIAVGFLMSLTAVGAFMALFFTALTVIYVGALLVASVTISTGVFLCACAVLFVAGWTAFFWVVLTGLSKGFKLFRGSIPFTSLAISTPW
ncbi:hypothetical protein O6H91_15G044300 [Diphasiastrum complanatum]|uniref:Uncharacterized protein n=1 Tax=Diphasiastrum complanatum TaxID=34168 RepID=A0ACC2BHP9_DIPCM|nr:hypothetical protein O6H91_Y552500 [Diphasiastrum complanatum]KAJ7529316.1 hypothetical protein O6H91_15G044300 [Diphasiastrum complanatum]